MGYNSSKKATTLIINLFTKIEKKKSIEKLVKVR